MKQLHSNSNKNYEIKSKFSSREFIVNNHNNSFDNWFVDTFIRIGIVLITSIFFIPVIIIGIIFSFGNYTCETNWLSIHWILFSTGLKTFIGYYIIVSRLYSESIIADVSYSKIIRLVKLWNYYIIFEIFYNLYITYEISNIKLSNCNIRPLTYLIIYLILNFIGYFYICCQYFIKN